VTELVSPTVPDAGRIAAVINARSLALTGATEETAEGVAQWFVLSDLDPDADMRLAVGADGGAEGYVDVSGPEDGTPKAWVDLRALADCPEALGRLFAWAQGRAAERVGVGGKIQFFVAVEDQALRARLEEAGYAVVRSSYEMERALDGDLEPPVWPAGLVPRAFAARDAETVHAAQDEAFADDWGYTPGTFERWRSHNLGPGADTSLWRVVWDGDEIAGLCINRGRRGEDETIGWVGELAVRRPWRRRGLGEALLREAFSAFVAAGKRAAGLGVDAENTSGAVALYERVGMRVVRRSDTWERAT
jgi:mycothiol synthase